MSCEWIGMRRLGQAGQCASCMIYARNRLHLIAIICTQHIRRIKFNTEGLHKTLKIPERIT